MKFQKFAVSFTVFTFLAPKNLFHNIGFWKILSQKSGRCSRIWKHKNNFCTFISLYLVFCSHWLSTIMLKGARLYVGKLVYKAGVPYCKKIIPWSVSLTIHLKLVVLCYLCIRTEIRSERTPVVHRAAAYYSLRH